MENRYSKDIVGWFRKEKKLLVILLTSTIINLVWSLVLLPFEMPDEQAHIGMVDFVATQGRVPEGKEKDLSVEIATTEKLFGTYRDELGNNDYTYRPEYKIEYTDSVIGEYETEIVDLNTEENRTNYDRLEAARYPVLYYWYESWWYRFGYNWNLIDRIYWIRLGSVILGSVTIWGSYRLGLEIWGKERYGLLLASLISLHPMLSFLMAGVNSDNLFNLLFIWLLYLCTRIIKSGITGSTWWWTGLVIGLGFWTKPQAYLMLPILGLALALRWWVTKQIEYKKVGWLLMVLTLVGGMHELPTIISLLSGEGFSYATFTNQQEGLEPDFLSFIKFSINKLYAQNIIWYWGVFKWLGVVLPKFAWWVTNRIVLIAAGSLAVWIGWRILQKIRKKELMYKGDNPSILLLFFLIGSSVIYLLGIFGFDWIHNSKVGYSFGVQGRYYFPVIGTHMALLLAGVSVWWPNTFRKWLFISLVGWFLYLQLAGMYTILTSYYHIESVTQLILELSQYKPWVAKGLWWYGWLSLYVGSLFWLMTVISRKLWHSKNDA